MVDEKAAQEQKVESTRYDQLQDSYSTIQLRLDPTGALELLRHRLLNEFWDEARHLWVRNTRAVPLMSDDGVEDLMTELNGRMSVDKVLGNIKEKDYKLIIREVGESTLSFMFHNKDLYGIDTKNYRRIVTLVKHNIEIFLSRPVAGFENRLLSKQFDYREVVNKREAEIQQEQQKSGFKFPFTRG